MKARTLFTALSSISIVLGLLELVAPKKIKAVLGVVDVPVKALAGRNGALVKAEHKALKRAQQALALRRFGLREVLSGLALFSPRLRRSAVQARLAGDARDLAALIKASSSSQRPRSIAAAIAAVAAITALDVLASQRA